MVELVYVGDVVIRSGCHVCVLTVTELVMTREYFAHRQDKLFNRVHNQQTAWMTEHFQPGRLKCLKGKNRQIIKL